MSNSKYEGLAHGLAQAALGQRLSLADRDRLAEVPDGVVVVDALAGQCRHSVAGELLLDLSEGLRQFTAKEVGLRRIDPKRVEAAMVEFSYDTNAVDTDHRFIVMFRLDCVGRVSTGAKTFERRLPQVMMWHKRQGA